MKHFRKKKRIQNIFLFAFLISYGIFLLLIVITNGTSWINEEHGKVVYHSSLLNADIIFGLITLFLLLLWGVYAIINLFKKPKEVQEETSENLKQIECEVTNIESDEYLCYFLRSLFQNKRDLLFFGVHSIYFTLYSLIFYFQKTMEKRMSYFYPIFIASLIFFLFFLLYLFILPLKEKAEKKKRNILYVFSEDDVLIKEAEETRVLFSNFKDAYETKRSFLFLSTNGFDLTLNKNAIQDEKLTELLQYQCERIHKNIN